MKPEVIKIVAVVIQSIESDVINPKMAQSVKEFTQGCFMTPLSLPKTF